MLRKNFLTYVKTNKIQGVIKINPDSALMWMKQLKVRIHDVVTLIKAYSRRINFMGLLIEFLRNQ